MNCPKCGEEYKPGQSFCLRCGAPIYESEEIEVPQNKYNENELTRTNIRVEEATVSFEDIMGDMALEEDEEEMRSILDRDLSRVKPANIGTYNRMVDDEEDESVSEPVYRKNSKQNKGMSKKNIVLLSVLGVLLVVVIIAVALLYNKSQKEKKFEKYYNAGIGYYNEKSYAAAATQFMNAVDYAVNNQDKISANEKLWKSYELIGGYDEEEIVVLEELVRLNPTDIDYYKALIILYQNNEMDDKIDSLIASVTDISMKEQLQDFDGTIPNPSLDAGEYDKPIEITLTVSNDLPIYYTLDGTEPTEDSTKYTVPIKFEKEGSYVIKAISVDNNGKTSKQLAAKYKLKFTVVNTPVVNLESGNYETQKKISVTADEGCKIYYTKDGSVPDANSTEYTKEFKMAKGNTVYSFVAINSDGISSKVVTRVYNFEEKYEYSYDDALSMLSSALVTVKTLENIEGEFANGDVMYYDYVGTKKIDKVYYYIVTGIIESENGVTISANTYAIACSTGECYSAEVSGSSYKLSDLKN